MIARYSQIQQQVAVLSALLKQPGHVQKIFSTSRYLCLQIRLPGKTFCLYIGRGSGAEGIWLGTEMPKSFLRLRDKWLEWCRKNLTSSLLIDIVIDDQDRAISLIFQKAGRKQEWKIAWIGRSCYFTFFDGITESGFVSWEGPSSKHEGFEAFDRVGRKNISDDSKAPPLTEINLLLEEEEKLAKKAATPKQKVKAYKTKISKIESDLQKIAQWKDLQQYLNILDPNDLEGVTQFKLKDLKYKFPSSLTVWQKRDILFQNIKRLKTAEVLQTRRLEETNQELNNLEKHHEGLENPLRPIGPVWKVSKEVSLAPVAQDGDYVVHSLEGFKVGVGASARGNDQLRKLWSKSEDWWVHSASGTSSHAIIKLPSASIPTTEQLRKTAQLIAKQSRITATQLEIIYTQVKNVRGVTGTPGMVTYKKTKNLLCELSEGEVG